MGKSVFISDCHEQGEWQALGRVVMTSCAEYVGQGSLTQVQVEPGQVWLELQSGAGAHSGCYDLLRFDGQELRLAASGFNSSPGAGWTGDLNGDGNLDVVLDQTEPYVFCYACSVRLRQYQVLTWDGQDLAEVRLNELPATAPQPLREANDRAVELARKASHLLPDLRIHGHRGIAYTDALVATQRGLNALTVDALPPSSDGDTIHWHRMSDTLAYVEPQALADAHSFTWQILQLIDGS